MIIRHFRMVKKIATDVLANALAPQEIGDLHWQDGRYERGQRQDDPSHPFPTLKQGIQPPKQHRCADRKPWHGRWRLRQGPLGRLVPNAFLCHDILPRGTLNMVLTISQSVKRFQGARDRSPTIKDAFQTPRSTPTPIPFRTVCDVPHGGAASG